AAKGAIVDGVYYCPHEEYPPCSCRKPAPGMLLSAAHAYEIEMGASWMIGDSQGDVEAGRNAGCRTARILTGGAAILNCDVVGASLLDAVEKVLKWDQPPVAHRRTISFCQDMTA